jgi:UDP-N-acetylmuramoylalanine--D-glutamate ligase
MGRAFSEVAMDVPANGFVSLEVSSFQLDRTIFFKPNVALLLNITPDHLNRYHFNMQEYVEAKYKVFANQDPGDILVLNADSEYLAPGSITTRAMIRYFSIYRFQDNGINRSEAGEIVSYSNSIPRFRCSVEDLFIRGEHNHANAMAAIEAVLPFVADQQKLIAGLKTFRGIEHRLELVKTIAGVQYINDSKATNIDSVWYALRSYEVPIILILGGIDKGNDYDKIRELVLEKVKKIYAIGESAEKVFKYFHRDVKVELKSTLEECVLSANSESHPGEIVLLSPACASFDMFKNYEHRGEVFKEAVLRLEE